MTLIRAAFLFAMRILIAGLLSAPALLCAADMAEGWAAGLEPFEKQIKLWPVLRSPGKDPMRELRPAGEVLGQPAQRAIATFSGDKLSKLDVLLLLVGASGVDAAFATQYGLLRQGLPAEMQKRMGETGEKVAADAGAAPDTEALQWQSSELSFRLVFEPGRRVWLSVKPIPAEQRAAMAAKKNRERLLARIKKNDAGDVWLNPIPPVEAVDLQTEEGRICMARTLHKFYEWKFDYGALQKMVNATMTYNIEELCKDLATEAGVSYRHFHGIDLKEVQKQIDQGEPVVFVRANEPARTSYLVNFAMEWRKDPALELSKPDAPKEQDKWGRINVSKYYWVCMIVGYNARRGEIIVSHPGYNASFQNLRMRIEEAEAGTYSTTYFGTP